MVARRKQIDGERLLSSVREEVAAHNTQNCILYCSKQRVSLDKQVRSGIKNKSTGRIQRQQDVLCFNYGVP